MKIICHLPNPVALLGLCLLSAVTSAQVDMPLQVEFEAGDVTVRGSVQDRPFDGPEWRPMPGLFVSLSLLNVLTNTFVTFHQSTDDEGRINIPWPYQPFTGSTRLEGTEVIPLRGFHHEDTILFLPFRDVVMFFPAVTGSGVTLFGEVPPSVEHVSAVYHVQRAHVAMGGYLARKPGPVKLKFEPRHNVETPAEYFPDRDEITLYEFGSPDQFLAGSSRSIMSHEVAHRFINHAWGTSHPSFMNEAFADYLAFAVTGDVLNGEGVSPNPRTVSNDFRFNSFLDEEAHVRGQVFAGALYDTRRLFGARSNEFDRLLRPLLEAHPSGEIDALDKLLDVDDWMNGREQDISNGTPNWALFYRGFLLEHGIPWPLSDLFPTGWGPNGAPLLSGSPAGSQLLLSLEGAPASKDGLLWGSLEPATPLRLPWGPIYLDPASTRVMRRFTTNSNGHASLVLALPPSLSGAFALSAAVASPSSPLGIAVSTGLRIML